jgi:NAD(P)-dependent dehydrogenase (short-subunit alcohol dehydrogenase family)
MNPFSLEGKTILITGASSGIGRGIAIVCSQMGANVVLNGRNHQRLQETYSMLVGQGHMFLEADLTIQSDICFLVERLPKLDGVVHCAGVGLRKLCRQIVEADIDYVMNANFKAPVMLQSELLAKKKINKGASIVFISSIAVDSPSIGNAIYSASKGAITSYANCLKLELASRLIRVNTIHPAMVWTDLIFKDGVEEEQLKADEQTYLLKRYGKPEDIANLAVYLLSDASEWMTGSHINITGGGQ